MQCHNVIPLLSEFFDEELDTGTAIQVSQHLCQCLGCRKEFDGIADVHKRLRSLDRITAPEVLRGLVQHRLAQQPWRVRLRNELERYWSIIRTTEGIWYATRALGTVMATLFFILTSSAINPIYIQDEGPIVQRTPYGPIGKQRTSLSQQVSLNVPRKLGVASTQLPTRLMPPAINDAYIKGYSLSNTEKGKDDTFAVAMGVDRSGAVKVETVIQRPADPALLGSFYEMIASARLRPASQNGQAVNSTLVFTFSRIFVSD